jgi:hypothetical protein
MTTLIQNQPWLNVKKLSFVYALIAKGSNRVTTTEVLSFFSLIIFFAENGRRYMSYSVQQRGGAL